MATRIQSFRQVHRIDLRIAHIKKVRKVQKTSKATYLNRLLRTDRPNDGLITSESRLKQKRATRMNSWTFHQSKLKVTCKSKFRWSSSYSTWSDSRYIHTTSKRSLTLLKSAKLKRKSSLPLSIANEISKCYASTRTSIESHRSASPHQWPASIRIQLWCMSHKTSTLDKRLMTSHDCLGSRVLWVLRRNQSYSSKTSLYIRIKFFSLPSTARN